MITDIGQNDDRYLRGLFVAGALAVICYAKIHGTKHRPLALSIAGEAPDQVAAGNSVHRSELN